jgi:plasmid stabilization system protein ParE
MPAIEVTRQARDELRELIRARELPTDTRDRVSRSLLTLKEFPHAGRQLSGVWRDCRAVIGPWGWLIVVYMYVEAEDRVVVVAFHDARESDAAIAGP